MAKVQHIIVHNEKEIEDIPSPCLCYVMTGLGLARLVKNKFFNYLEYVSKETPVLGLPEIKGFKKPNLPKIPFDLFMQVAAFGKGVEKKHNKECCIMFFLDKENHYKIVVPKQEIGGASVHVPDQPLLEDCVFAGDIHTHPGTLGAFQSGTDSSDESHLDGFYITLGGLKNFIPDSHCRIRIGNEFIKCELSDLVEIPDYSFPKEWMEQLIVKSWLSTNDNKKFPEKSYYDKGKKDDSPISFLVYMIEGVGDENGSIAIEKTLEVLY